MATVQPSSTASSTPAHAPTPVDMVPVLTSYSPESNFLTAPAAPVTSTKPVPPPAPLPRRFDPNMFSQKVVYPPKEACFKYVSCACPAPLDACLTCAQPARHVPFNSGERYQVASGDADSRYDGPRGWYCDLGVSTLRSSGDLEVATTACGYGDKEANAQAGQSWYVSRSHLHGKTLIELQRPTRRLHCI